MNHSLVLVDTSIFVDFLRETQSVNSKLKLLIEEDRVVLSKFVKLELLRGVRKTERKNLSQLFDSLNVLKFDPKVLELAESMLLVTSSTGLNCGLIDLFIVIEALSGNFKLHSNDKVMCKLAKMLDVELV